MGLSNILIIFLRNKNNLLQELLIVIFLQYVGLKLHYFFNRRRHLLKFVYIVFQLAVESNQPRVILTVCLLTVRPQS